MAGGQRTQDDDGQHAGDAKELVADQVRRVRGQHGQRDLGHRAVVHVAQPGSHRDPERQARGRAAQRQLAEEPASTCGLCSTPLG